jgi:hypothetical protein
MVCLLLLGHKYSVDGVDNAIICRNISLHHIGVIGLHAGLGGDMKFRTLYGFDLDVFASDIRSHDLAWDDMIGQD